MLCGYSRSFFFLLHYFARHIFKAEVALGSCGIPRHCTAERDHKATPNVIEATLDLRTTNFQHIRKINHLSIYTCPAREPSFPKQTSRCPITNCAATFLKLKRTPSPTGVNHERMSTESSKNVDRLMRASKWIQRDYEDCKRVLGQTQIYPRAAGFKETAHHLHRPRTQLPNRIRLPLPL